MPEYLIEFLTCGDPVRDSEALYHSLVETMPLVLWRKDREGRFTFVNRGFHVLFGQIAENIVGKTDFDIFPRELAESFRKDDLRVIKTGECLSLDEPSRSAEGNEMYVRTFKSPVRNAQGDIIGTQGLLWEITDLKQTKEELRQANAELSRLRQQQGRAAQ